jgi:hypothetical protein
MHRVRSQGKNKVGESLDLVVRQPEVVSRSREEARWLATEITAQIQCPSG